MTRQINIENLTCLCSTAVRKDRIVYILYPTDTLSAWIEPAAQRQDTTIVIITGMDWQNVFSPWPAPGVPKSSPDFKGQSPEFLHLLQSSLIPQIEATLQIDPAAERNLVGVSMSGLFALWQWMQCDTFRSIASLSGSFWYEGFIPWIKQISIPRKTGKAYFLLGDQESHSNVKAFNTVGQNTAIIITLLTSNDITTEFQSVPGNHFSHPLPRLEKALTALYPSKFQTE